MKSSIQNQKKSSITTNSCMCGAKGGRQKKKARFFSQNGQRIELQNLFLYVYVYELQVLRYQTKDNTTLWGMRKMLKKCMCAIPSKNRQSKESGEKSAVAALQRKHAPVLKALFFTNELFFLFLFFFSSIKSSTIVARGAFLKSQR